MTVNYWIEVGLKNIASSFILLCAAHTLLLEGLEISLNSYLAISDLSPGYTLLSDPLNRPRWRP